MILTTVGDQALKAAIRRAARPDEDVVFDAPGLVGALEFGYPRLAVQRRGEFPLMGTDGPVPPVFLGEAALRQWRSSWRECGRPLGWVDFLAERLGPALRGSWQPSHVDLALRDLSHLAGRALPPALVGMARRTLEFPRAYVDGVALEALTGLSTGALKARFRRRELPSPFSYLRWLRCLAIGAVLRDGCSVADAARRLGWANSGNLCRHVVTTAGCPPSALAEDGAWETLLVRFTGEFLSSEALERWDSLDDLFLRGVA
jgi:AraC-like DNA-binding protein